MRFLERFVIEAPIARVFDVFSDVSKSPERIEAIRRVQIQGEQARGPGTRWLETRRLGKRECSVELTITEFVENETFTVRGSMAAHVFDTKFTFADVTATADSATGDAATRDAATEVTLECTSRPTGIMGYFLTPLMLLFKGMIRRDMMKDMNQLRTHLQAHPLADREADLDADLEMKPKTDREAAS